ncbi:hypothetical protein LLB_1658 [Legionella longbeachae D-4968]|nr:hypothetical protein LLB_1658 [Legionella longbeachae D-4968]
MFPEEASEKAWQQVYATLSGLIRERPKSVGTTKNLLAYPVAFGYKAFSYMIIY